MTYDRDAYRAKLIAEAAERDRLAIENGTLVLYRDHRIEPGYMGWQYSHVDYDGDEDNRYGTGFKSVDECKAEIDDWFEEVAERDRAAVLAPFNAIASIFEKAAKS